MTSSLKPFGAVMAAFTAVTAAAAAAVPASASAATLPVVQAVQGAMPLQPSAAALDRVAALVPTTDAKPRPWGEVWVEYGPFLEFIQP